LKELKLAFLWITPISLYLMADPPICKGEIWQILLKNPVLVCFL